MKLTFNIIYTPGSVRYLAWFVLSLLKWSGQDVTYRLISNGCSSEEEALLQALCDKNERLEFFRLSSPKTLKHAAALNKLQMMEDSETFCFLDSDILATGDFLGELRPFLRQADAVCSGHAIWATVPERRASLNTRILRGSHSHVEDRCLGSTFFAIYDNRSLKRVTAKYGIAFDRFRKWERIPLSARRTLSAQGFGPKLYDTGKILNILLQAEGGTIIHKDSDSLVHIGGISKRAGGNAQNQHDFLWYLRRGNWKGVIDVSQNWREWPLLRRKANVSRYFTDFLESLVEGLPFKGRVRVREPEIRQEVYKATREIQDFYFSTRTPALSLTDTRHA